MDGITDTHIPLPELLDVDPYSHIRGKPWYDLDVLFYGDAWYHDLSHDPNSQQEQGYLIADEPNESKFDVLGPVLYTIAATLAVFFLREYARIDIAMAPAELVMNADYVESLIDRELGKKAQRIKALESELYRK